MIKRILILFSMAPILLWGQDGALAEDGVRVGVRGQKLAPYKITALSMDDLVLIEGHKAYIPVCVNLKQSQKNFDLHWHDAKIFHVEIQDDEKTVCALIMPYQKSGILSFYFSFAPKEIFKIHLEDLVDEKVSPEELDKDLILFPAQLAYQGQLEFSPESIEVGKNLQRATPGRELHLSPNEILTTDLGQTYLPVKYVHRNKGFFPTKETTSLVYINNTLVGMEMIPSLQPGEEKLVWIYTSPLLSLQKGSHQVSLRLNWKNPTEEFASHEGLDFKIIL